MTSRRWIRHVYEDAFAAAFEHAVGAWGGDADKAANLVGLTFGIALAFNVGFAVELLLRLRGGEHTVMYWPLLFLGSLALHYAMFMHRDRYVSIASRFRSTPARLRNRAWTAARAYVVMSLLWFYAAAVLVK